jgi:hypothetical protein
VWWIQVYIAPVPKKDFAQLALSIVQKATGTARAASNGKTKGRAGGLKGGKARAESLPPKKRSEIAKIAAAARWKKKG